MKARDIYLKIRTIADPYHAYADQMVAIAKWIESEFDYNPQKLRDNFNPCPSKHELGIIKEPCVLCGKLTDVDKSTPIELRENYVEGGGEVCNDCMKNHSHDTE